MLALDQRPALKAGSEELVTGFVRKRGMGMPPYAKTDLCPHCAAPNLAHRRECWRCGRTLPMSFALEHSVDEPSSSQPPTDNDVKAALEKAIAVDGTRPLKTETDEETESRLFRWLFPWRNKHTEA